MREYKFSKKDRSTFEYWFAHWCAFQMTALNLHIWKPKYLFHDIEKPWLMLFWKDYSRVQKWHRNHNNHHLERIAYSNGKNVYIDVDAMIIDNECSRFTKSEAPMTALEYFTKISNESHSTIEHAVIQYALDRIKELGLTK